MKRTQILSGVCLLLTSLLYSQHSQSPYFHIQSEAGPGSLPLVSNEAKVIINGPIADVRISQTYRNDGPEPIEAMYIFPASTRAAVYHMEMRIGERTITAEIMEKHAARATYETAREEGKRAGLLEQHRPNVFQMQVANILSGDQVEVVLRYTEFIIPQDQVYTFVYPTVVGPRYTGQMEEQPQAAFAAMPYTPEGQLPAYQFGLEVDLRMPVPVASIACTSHLTQVARHSDQDLSVRLDPTEHQGGNRDFILNYRLSGDEIISGVMTYSDGDEHYFLCQVEPPRLEASPTIVPREYIFILDVSGSMSGFPLDVSKRLMRNLLSDIRPTDKFNILCFAGSAFVLHAQPVFATRQNISMALQRLSNVHGGGSTELLPALRHALSIPRSPGFSRAFVIATDGYVIVEEEAFKVVHQKLNEASFYAFGIGSGVNRHLIEGLAHVGRGEPFIVTGLEEAHDVADRLQEYIAHPVMTDISVAGHHIDLDGVIPAQIPDLTAARPIYCFGKYTPHQDAALTVSGNISGKAFKQIFRLPEPSNDHAALPYLWARETIRFLDDFNVVNTTQARIDEITRLGLQYNLLTQYTSFVAVDHEPVTDGAPQQVRQPLPLPQGVSNLAVGFELELDILDTGATTLSVDVQCAQKDVRAIVEVVLEEIMQALVPAEMQGLSGLQWTFRLGADGRICTLSANVALPQQLARAFTAALQSLGLDLGGEHVVSIVISSANDIMK
ncbi:MAG: VIT domain-containing protein [Saprospiraceae bacterium]|nr:VIT domain-containing protein [Saprospiraceae bacterium]